MTRNIAIIGGGAAGMMCVASILEGWKDDEQKPRVTLFEKNKRLGAKVIISGGGRCNVTTGTFKRKELLQHYTRGADFLDYSFRQFGPKKVRKRFEEHSVPLKEEDDGRIFPISNNGKDIVAVFEKLFAQHQVQLCFEESVEHIEALSNGGFEVTTTHGATLYNHVVIATGGSAYAHTGSTGDGYSFARQLGHTITPLGPSLNSFVCAETWIHDCSGISFPHARLQARGQANMKQSGPVLLTHFGISGPHTFVLASQYAFVDISAERPLLVHLQIDASQSYESWETFLLEQIDLSPRKRLANILAGTLPKRFVESFLVAHGYSQQSTGGSLSKTERKKLAKLLGDGIPLSLIKRKPGDEFVTAGGVVTDEVNAQTMESKIHPGLYFVGEVLNIDGVTGGYNLQSARATGKIAGDTITEKYAI